MNAIPTNSLYYPFFPFPVPLPRTVALLPYTSEIQTTHVSRLVLLCPVQLGPLLRARRIAETVRPAVADDVLGDLAPGDPCDGGGLALAQLTDSFAKKVDLG